MKSVIEVYNTALGRLGGNQFERVNTPEDESAVATLCRTFFPHVLDKALAHSEWGFARKTVALGLKADDIVNPDYPYRYALPTDCVRPVALRGHDKGPFYSGYGDRYCGQYRYCDEYRHTFDYPYIIDGPDILTTVSPAVLVYVRRVEDPVSWPALFADAVAYALAAELATAYVNDRERQQIFAELAERRLAEAAAVELNSQRKHRQPSPWLLSR